MKILEEKKFCKRFILEDLRCLIGVAEFKKLEIRGKKIINKIPEMFSELKCTSFQNERAQRVQWVKNDPQATS